MLNPDNETLEWCAKWIEDSLRAETNERTIEFGKNMAMTIRAVKTSTQPPAVPLDARERAREIVKQTYDEGCEWHQPSYEATCERLHRERLIDRIAAAITAANKD